MLLGIFHRLMIERIENLNDGALAIQRMRDIHARIVHVHQRFCQEGFPVSRLAVDQERIS